MGEASILEAERHWLRSGSQRMIVGALPVAVTLSLGCYAMGFLLPSFVLVYAVGALLLLNLALCTISFSLRGIRDRRGRWFSLALGFSGLVGILSCLWLIAETLLLGLPTGFPGSFLVIDSLSNVPLIIGLAAASLGRHQRRLPRFAGYLFLSLLLIACIFVTYQTNLVGNPPTLLALGLGGRILLSFFSAIFAWSLLSIQSPPFDVVGRATRGMLVVTLVLQILARTLFAFQYATLHEAVGAFFLVGSPSDVLSLFSQCGLVIVALAFFTQTVGVMPTARPAVIKYAAASRTLLLTTLVTAVLVTATTAIALVWRVLPVFLSDAEVMLALHTIAGGLVLGVVIVLLAFGVAASALTRVMTRPLRQLDDRIGESTQAGLASYQAPRNLVFAELQSVSDGYGQALDALKRTRSQLRAPDPFAQRQPGVQAAPGADFYSAVLERQTSIASEVIARNAQALVPTVQDKGDANRRLKDVIAATEQLQEVLRMLQKLRQVESGVMSEVSSKDLGNILQQVAEETKAHFAQRAVRIDLRLSEPHCRVLANDLVTDVFTSILRCIVGNDASEEVVIDLTVNQVQEAGTSYWQTIITSHGWVVGDEQRDTMFQRDVRQAGTAAPGLLLAKAIVDGLHGALRTSDEVSYDQRSGTAFAVLLPAVMQDQPLRFRTTKPPLKPPEA